MAPKSATKGDKRQKTKDKMALTRLANALNESRITIEGSLKGLSVDSGRLFSHGISLFLPKDISKHSKGFHALFKIVSVD